MAGGTDLDFGIVQSIYALQCFSLKCRWIKLWQEIEIARHARETILIPDDMTSCRKANKYCNDVYCPYDSA